MSKYLLWALIRRIKCNRLAVWLASHLPHHAAVLSGYSLESIVRDLSQYSMQPKTGCIASTCQCNEKKYDLDIIVPVYKTEKTIRRCLDSILNQKTKYAIRVICIDDGSPDRTGIILDEYARKDARVQVIHQENRGLSGARNSGLNRISSKYLMFVDSDDYLEPDSIEPLLNETNEKKTDIVISGYHLVDMEGNVITTIRNVPQNCTGSVHTLGYMWTTLWKSDLFTDICFPEGYWFEDGLNWIILSRLAKSCYWSDVVLYNYVQNPEGITNRSLYSKKAVDTILVCWQLISDAQRVPGIRSWDRTGYIDFLKHVRVSEQRLRFQSGIIQKESFLFFCLLYEKYFKKVELEDEKWTLLEKALELKNELLYHVFCELV